MNYKNTSWQKVAKWYNKSVGLELLKLNGKSSLLDLGCGQGILAKHILQS